MPSESPSISPNLAQNRLSSLRLSGSPSSSPTSVSSSAFMPPPRPNRPMTPGELHNAMEQEQEHITNNLLKHIDQLKADKIRIEHELEAESEAVMNRLTRELSNLRAKLEAAGIPAPIESSTPRSPSRSPSRASSLSRRSVSGANSPRLIAGSPPTVSPVLGTRRDSVEQFRGRANSSNGTEVHGIDRLLESLKFENGEYKKALRELDDRYRCKQAECEKQREEIQALRLEIALLQRKANPSTPSLSTENLASSIPSNNATWGTVETENKKNDATPAQPASDSQVEQTAVVVGVNQDSVKHQQDGTPPSA